MRNLTDNLKTKVIIEKRLLDYGFTKDYTYEKQLSNSNFKAVFEYKNNTLISKVMDMELDEDYVLVDVKTPIGKFAAEIKKEYEEIIDDIIGKCTKTNIFKLPQSKRVMEFIEDKYNSNLEFLWKKFPKDAIYRNNANSKWFAVLLVVEKSKIGLEGSGEIEIIDLKHDNVKRVIDDKSVFKGYHMNKKHWITISMDERLNDDELFKLIEHSFKLVRS